MVDRECVQRAQTGDRKAVVMLLRELEAPVYRTAYYTLGHEQDAMDAAQEALLRIYRKLGTFRGDADIRTWAQRIAVNAAIDHARSKKDVLPFKEEAAGGSNPVERSGIHSDVREAIQRLPEPQRSVVLLRHLHDFSYQEIASTLEIPVNTVKSHLFRGRKKLMEWLSDYREGGVLP
ncbi:RNA polymerase sigma-70 factor (ECF subfamily) [Desmospora profundinema]|uniref:RNA polymerase sigma-70 factor (ECF subfamily) n=1 Tax=Desmospora profundinema TaxID=1571184 RepID=A0ABU1ILQ2_9BACL|nr:RNA polymerase sigma factor [Desmospora profundinema]MDR6225084.1 RNA polymerase sigma-70 factor (ECF subfamily) [Desmospora profundinema]